MYHVELYARVRRACMVEGMMVGYVRRNFLVPVPSFQSFDALNAHLERSCLG